VVRAHRVQEPLKVVLSWCGLGRVALGVRHLAHYHRDKVIVMTTLVILLLLEA
jgi:hypothetical protein